MNLGVKSVHAICSKPVEGGRSTMIGLHIFGRLCVACKKWGHVCSLLRVIGIGT